MPFKSLAELRFLFAKKPEVAQKFRSDYPNQDLKNLPEHVTPGAGPKKKKRRAAPAKPAMEEME